MSQGPGPQKDANNNNVDSANPASWLPLFPPGTSSHEAEPYMRRANGDVSAALTAFLRDGAARRQRAGEGRDAAARPPQQPQQQYYVGGGQSSGQSVVGPGDTLEAVEHVFQRARENGARDASDVDGQRHRDSGVVAFAGAGRRLGHLEGPSPVIAPVRKVQKRVRITFYQNGFQVDDGPLRSLTDAAGTQFLESINRGFIPRELVAQHGDADINVDLVDRRDEPYVPPAYTAFAGQGKSLASSSSSSAGPPPAVASNMGSNVASAPTATSAAPSVVVTVDPAIETCKVIILNLMGKQNEFTVNPTVHTVADLRALAATTQGAPALPVTSFDLMVRDFPPRVLLDNAQTVEEAKCRNATIMMKRR